MHFHEQLLFISKWFHVLSECEQILVLNTFLNQINLIQAQFVQLILDNLINNSSDDCKDLKANDLAHISNLILKPTNKVVVELTRLLPQFRPINDESATEYISHVSSLLSQNKLLDWSLSYRLIYLLYIHPSFSKHKDDIIRLLRLCDQNYNRTCTDGPFNYERTCVDCPSNYDCSFSINRSEHCTTDCSDNYKNFNLDILEDLAVKSSNTGDNYLNILNINGLDNHAQNYSLINHELAESLKCNFIGPASFDSCEKNLWSESNFSQLPCVQITDTTNLSPLSTEYNTFEYKKYDKNCHVSLQNSNSCPPCGENFQQYIHESRSVPTSSDTNCGNTPVHPKLSRTTSLSTFPGNPASQFMGISPFGNSSLGFGGISGYSCSTFARMTIPVTTTTSAFAPTCEEQTMLLAPMREQTSLSSQSSATSSTSFKSDDLSPDFGKEEIDPAMNDVGVWLKSLRLHKYTNLFQRLSYSQFINLSDQQLAQQGITKKKKVPTATPR